MRGGIRAIRGVLSSGYSSLHEQRRVTLGAGREHPAFKQTPPAGRLDLWWWACLTHSNFNRDKNEAKQKSLLCFAWLKKSWMDFFSNLLDIRKHELLEGVRAFEQPLRPHPPWRKTVLQQLIIRSRLIKAARHHERRRALRGLDRW